jgi:hypothetical protein
MLIAQLVAHKKARRVMATVTSSPSGPYLKRYAGSEF